MDASKPATLRMMAMKCIVQHIDSDVHSRMIDVETAEQQTLTAIAQRGFWSDLDRPEDDGDDGSWGDLDLPED